MLNVASNRKPLPFESIFNKIKKFSWFQSKAIEGVLPHLAGVVLTCHLHHGVVP